jgi:hypothetical protein
MISTPERPTVFIWQRRKQQVDMIGHYDCGKQVDSYCALPQTVIQDDIACFLGWDQRAAGAESNEQRCVGFLPVREAATTILILRA